MRSIPALWVNFAVGLLLASLCSQSAMGASSDLSDTVSLQSAPNTPATNGQDDTNLVPATHVGGIVPMTMAKAAARPISAFVNAASGNFRAVARSLADAGGDPNSATFAKLLGSSVVDIRQALLTDFGTQPSPMLKTAVALAAYEFGSEPTCAINTGVLSISGAAIKTLGEALDVRYRVCNFNPATYFDLYVAVQPPRGDMLFLSLSGSSFPGTPTFAPIGQQDQPVAYLTNTLLPDMEGSVLDMPALPLTMATGTYTFYAVPVASGGNVMNPSEWVGGLASAVLVLNAPPIVMDTFELVASDGGSSNDAYNNVNDWGSHQPRITRHVDGSIRLIYNSLPDGAQSDTWHVMKKGGENGLWSPEASATHWDDMFLLRDPVTDKAHVISTTPGSYIRTIYSSPDFSATPIPGSWFGVGTLTNQSRQYSGAGIGADGTVCFKNSNEFVNGTGDVANTNTEYICGKMNETGIWTWNSKINHYIGKRNAYDYLFPGVENSNSFLATQNQQTSVAVEGWTGITSWGYIFAGVNLYKSGYASDANWAKSYIIPPLTPDPNYTGDAPVQRQRDAYVDSHKRTIVSSYRSDPRNASINGLYVTVSDTNGNVLLDRKWGSLLKYGFVRVFEDSYNHLWMLWTAEGVSQTMVMLYPVTVVTSPSFDLRISNYIDLSSVVSPYRIRGAPYLAVPRGGNQRDNAIDGMMVACGTTYPSNCGGPDKIFYFRIRLPEIIPPACSATTLDVSTAMNDGFSYEIIKTFGTPPDSSANPTISTLSLFEDEIEIGPAHSYHAEIHSIGQGRFSHWTDGATESLRLSASDNSDPRSNGKRYSYCIK